MLIMDGLNISDIEKLYEDISNESQSDSEEEDESIHLPKYIVLDSTLQDEDLNPNRYQKDLVEVTRSQKERELEVKFLNPNSIRRSILVRSLKERNNRYISETKTDEQIDGDTGPVMNIVEPGSENVESHDAESETNAKSDSNESPASRSIVQPETVSDQFREESANLKRKHPATKRIEEFFSKSKFPKLDKINGCNIDNNESDHTVSPNDQTGDNELRNESNNEDLQCPYCFKSYKDFNTLEEHVVSCNMKTSIDIYGHYYSHRTSGGISPIISQPTTTRAQSSQPNTSRKKIKPSIKRPSSAKVASSQTKLFSQYQSSQQPISPSNSSQKTSYYERFIECNSQSLKTSPKIEPFSCPYCKHGYLRFEILQEHVKLCSKNDNKNDPN